MISLLPGVSIAQEAIACPVAPWFELTDKTVFEATFFLVDTGDVLHEDVFQPAIKIISPTVIVS